MGDQLKVEFVEVSEATAKIITPKNNVITVIGNEYIRSTFEYGCIQQAINIADAPGIDEVVLGADGHWGYGCPVGSTFSSRDMIYPNAVGPDVKCSMSFIQFNIPADVLKDKALRSALVKAIEERIPTGPGSHMPKKAVPFDDTVLDSVAAYGAGHVDVLDNLEIPSQWASFCEDASHGDPDALYERLWTLKKQVPAIGEKMYQLGGVGGGNHFLECNVVNIAEGMEETANTFGLINGKIGFLSHFGSRGFGFSLTSGCRGYDGQFRLLKNLFESWHIPFPGNDPHNVYMPVGTPQCNDYLNDMALASNFATINHLLVNKYIVDAFTEVLGSDVAAHFVYYIAHNIIRREMVDKNFAYVHRKGATRAFGARHYELKDTPFYDTGHPILLPGNPVDGSTIMVGQKGAKIALNSVNHGAGRAMSRKEAKNSFSQHDVTKRLDEADIVTNCGRKYPVDECPGAYKPYDQVIGSVVQAGLASIVATLKPVMNIKDNDNRQETSA